MHSRASLVVLIAVVVTMIGCTETTVDMGDRERFFAATESQESLVREYARRYQRAKAKQEAYQPVLDQVETDLEKTMGELAALREANTKRAQEIRGLQAEQKKLDAEVETRTAAKDSAIAALVAAAKDSAAAADGVNTQKKALAAARAERRKIDGQLAKLSWQNAELKKRIETMIAEIGKDAPGDK